MKKNCDHDPMPAAWPASLKKTRSRVAILELLAEASEPMDASELLFAMRERGIDIWLSTVYRSLESLEKANLIENCRLPGSDSLRFSFRSGGHLHYAVCLNCHKMLPLPSCPLQEIDPYLEQEGFQMSGHKVELYGLCRECSMHKSKEGCDA